MLKRCRIYGRKPYIRSRARYLVGEVITMTKTLLDVDNDLLEEATVALGTLTKKDTVNEALRLAVEAARERRREGLEALRRIADEGGFDFDRLAELDQ